MCYSNKEVEEKVFFSIIIPTYNRSGVLSKAIESIIVQQCEAWELIIVDDGSTDDTKKIVQEFLEEDSRIRYVFQENQERSAARNKGIKHANGDWICFLDSDDVYLTNHLEILRQNILANSEFFFFSTLRKSQPATTIKNDFDFVLKERIHCQQVCIKTSILLENTFNEKISNGEDLELWFRIIKNGHKIYLINKESINVIDHLNRSINLKNYHIEKKNLDFKEDLIHQTKNFLSKSTYKQELSNIQFKKSILCLKTNRIKSVLYLIKSIFFDLRSDLNNHKLLLLLSILKLYSKDLTKNYL